MAEPKIETDWREVGVMFGLAVVAASIVYAVGRYVERRRENPAAENRA